ncbi:hypothetical protein BKN38_09225 [Helicobacter sp. CLO-3]|uniref:NAD(P)H-dependent oxidoreductase n=1 Tax=unclassified Helicobacter TaxID=2593540 RepID=UPI000804D0CC|nr:MULTISPECIES: NAD(P)H-dependent oxidoreductase [unclassified Helicobacter]OBV28687.1 hypothetical protein BA723_08515 [Helicobacter sp. CLO-3]OHU81353.1 hypothetical protein BKN38_09225 [Helicobacter sp. CLO-3]
MNEFLQAMRFRHACKKFDASKKIAKEDFDAILESGRLTPSSFGLEPTRLLVVRDEKMRERVRKACWDQAQITDSSEIVIYVSKIADMQATSNYVAQSFSRKLGKDIAQLSAYQERFGGFLRANGYVDANSIFAWSSRQAYLMASSMMDCAAFMGIDSCAIEGFDRDMLESCLGLDTFAERVAFGYRVADPAQKAPRISIDELVRYI